MGQEALIEVQGLRKEYPVRHGEPVVALDRITFEISEHEFVACVGPSGCGKSTLLRILAGLLPPSSGELLFRGRPLAKVSRDVGIVFQNPVLMPWRTVLANALLPAQVLGLPRDYEIRARNLLRIVGLEGFEGRYPFELSGGMQQRAAIVRALLHNPALLLMDEPFGALDAMTRETMNVELRRIWLHERKTVFFITHSIPEAVFLANRVMVLSPRPGRIVEMVAVNLPDERGLGIMNTPEFGRYVSEIRRHFAHVDRTEFSGREGFE